MTDPGFDRVGKIGSDGNPLVRVKHFMWQYICCVDMSDEVRQASHAKSLQVKHCSITIYLSYRISYYMSYEHEDNVS